MFTKVIETERLILRPFRMDDVVPSHEIDSDPEVTRYTNDGGVKSMERIETLIRDVVLADYARYGFGRFAVDLKETQEFIGFCGLKYLPEYNEVDLGYRFRRTLWGKGIATEAGRACIDFGFTELALDSIIAMVLPENKASVRVMEKLGFKFSHVLEEDGINICQYILNRASNTLP